MRTVLVTACCWLACVMAARAQPPARTPRPLPANLPETNPYTSPEDLALGKKLYQGRCGHCHGQNGEGGRGAVLTAGSFRHGGSDRELFATIRNGIPNTEMPGAFSVPAVEIWRVVGYVQQLSRQGAPERSTGDPEAGSGVYQRSGCVTCHTIRGAGGFLGPDLTDVGAKRALRYLRQSVTDPSADISLDYRSVSVTDRQGRTVSGVHLNEDEYSIHLRDADGNLRSFFKRDLAAIALPRQSLMPSYTSLSPVDLDNLVAYLASLRP
jgi:putative heme-binding domain-containing protein